ncbi:MAG: hypothetical protein NT062_37575 [Proteobacteria bacterium]|nr:hypothetical protein [Pseudomonadota bacterium]
MRALGLLLLVTGCSNELTPSGYATFDGPERVISSRTTAGYVNYGGAPLRAWTITLATGDGCTDTSKVFELEINLLADGSGIPVAAIPIRANQTPDVLPSALARYNGAPVTVGTITMDGVTKNLISGTFTATTVSGEVSGEFDSPICASP